MESSSGYLINTIYHNNTSYINNRVWAKPSHTAQHYVSSSYYYLNYLLQTIWLALIENYLESIKGELSA